MTDSQWAHQGVTGTQCAPQPQASALCGTPLAPSCSASFERPANCSPHYLLGGALIIQLAPCHLELGLPQWFWNLEVPPCPPLPTLIFTHKYFPDLYDYFTIISFVSNKHQGSLRIPECPGTGYVDQAGLNLQRSIRLPL